MLRCDAIIWEDGEIDEKDRPVILLGMKGILSVELVSKGPSRDAHSMLAVLIENPAWQLVKALNTMRDNNGKIMIKNWYKEVRAFTDEELTAIENQPFDGEEYKKEYGITKFVNNVDGIEAKKALVGEPTCNIFGLISGYTGEGAKTVLPSNAIARLDFRLVPEMNPEALFERLKDHIREKGFSDLIDINLLGKQPPARTSISHPFVKLVVESAKETYGTAIISISCAGTGPMFYFHKILAAPCVCMGASYKFCREHSPNEFMRIDILNKTTKCIGNIIEKFAGTSNSS